jgi:nicotinate-nucleotide adenylyltransferase
MTVTIFSGTFDPIHNAHLVIAEGVRDALRLDKITFIPAFKPPHGKTPFANAFYRMEMLKLALESNNHFEINDIEYRLGKTSYSYKTIVALKQELQTNEKFNFIIGSDAFELIDTWYEAADLAKEVKFIIVPRRENFSREELFRGIKLKDFDYEIIKTPFLEISSYDIRERIVQKKSIKYQVPDKVEIYIYENSIYEKG